MDLRFILNPVDEPPRATNTTANVDGKISQPSTENENDASLAFNTPPRLRRSSPPTVPSTSKSANPQGIHPPIVLSPTQGTLYARRASTSAIRVPALPSLPERDPATYDPGDFPTPTHETNINRVSVFNELLQYPELILEVAKAFDLEDLISLYAISRDFHMLVNIRFTAMMLGQATTRADESRKIFAWRCYKSVCMRDPALRINDTRPDELRFIPSFRWLRMILFREAVVDDILRSLEMEGHRMPKRASEAIKKIWFTIDISDNARRIGIMHNRNFWEDKDLYLATMFFLKLDMRLTHPTTGNGETGLRKMLLGQRSLSTLARVLRREEMRNRLDMLKMVIRYDYSPPRQTCKTILGVTAAEVGRLQWEGWGECGRKNKFVGICELVMKEGIRRRLGLQGCYVDMMCFGYIDRKTFQDVRRKPVVEEMVEEDEESESEGEGESESEGGREGGEDRESRFSGVESEREGENTAEEQMDEEDEMDYGAPEPRSASLNG